MLSFVPGTLLVQRRSRGVFEIVARATGNLSPPTDKNIAGVGAQIHARITSGP